MIEVNTIEEYEEAIKDGTVIVDCFATWCNPCLQILKILPRLEEKLPDWKIIKVDIDKLEEVKDRYMVRSVPTFIFFKDGQIKNQFSGVKPLADIEKLALAIDEN